MSEENESRLSVKLAELMHAVQSGVAYSMNIPGDKACEPKHLRVGVNASLIDTAAIADLLIQKGIFTKEEYLESLCKFAQNDVDTYEKELSDHFGTSVKLA